MSKAKSIIEQRGDFYISSVEVDIFGDPEGLPKDSHLAHKYEVSIKWYFDEEYRTWGIKSLTPIVPDQDISLVFIESTEDEDIEHSIEWTIKDTEFKFESDEVISLQVMPITLEIDFFKKKSTLIFRVS